MNVNKLIMRLLLGRRLPTTSGAISVPALTGPVAIRRDAYGIPHVEAEGDEDAWYGLGFCQGQDRAFQLELLLRAARGTLSELFGSATVPIDRLSRRLGLLHGASAHLQAQAPAFLPVIEAFSRGITDGVRLGCRRVPHEFALLRAKPTPYTALDAVAVTRLQSFLMATTWDLKLARLHILREDGPEALAALDPPYPDWLPVSDPLGGLAGPSLDRLGADLKALEDILGKGGASNAWAIGPSRTATGRPILANDPHLPPRLPPYWYLAHVSTPDWAVAGGMFVGLPVFPMGHNGTAAWGVTLGLADNADLFIEELGPDSSTVREADGYAKCQTRDEVIRVKGGPDIVESVVVPPRGPIIGPAMEGDVGSISIKAAWLDPRPFTGLFKAQRARSIDEFRNAFRDWSSISLNMMYADTSGALGWQLVGEVPRRHRGAGTVPMPGWDAAYQWEDSPVAFEDMPRLVGPPDGYVAVANNQPTASSQGPYLGRDWIDGYRLARILQVLEKRRDWGLPASQSLQLDVGSVVWTELRDVILNTKAGSPDSLQALELLRDWDGVLSATSTAASVFELFLAEMHRRLVRARAPKAWEWALGKGSTQLISTTIMSDRRMGLLVRLLKENTEGWFEAGWPEIVDEALATAVRELRTRYGKNPSSWKWGDIRQVTLGHPMGRSKLLAPAFNLGPFPLGGDGTTVSQAKADPADPTANPVAIASARMVLDVGNWDESRFALPGGQSGNPLSPHYDDMLLLWSSGEGVPIAWSTEAVKRTTRTLLRLLPDRGS